MSYETEECNFPKSIHSIPQYTSNKMFYVGNQLDKSKSGEEQCPQT